MKLYTCTCMYTYIHVYIYIYVRIYMYMHIYIFIHTHAYTYKPSHAVVGIAKVQTARRSTKRWAMSSFAACRRCTLQMATQRPWPLLVDTLESQPCSELYIYIHIYIYIHVYTHTHAHIYIIRHCTSDLRGTSFICDIIHIHRCKN